MAEGGHEFSPFSPMPVSKGFIPQQTMSNRSRSPVEGNQEIASPSSALSSVSSMSNVILSKMSMNLRAETPNPPAAGKSKTCYQLRKMDQKWIELVTRIESLNEEIKRLNAEKIPDISKVVGSSLEKRVAEELRDKLEEDIERLGECNDRSCYYHSPEFRRHCAESKIADLANLETLYDGYQLVEKRKAAKLKKIEIQPVPTENRFDELMETEQNNVTENTVNVPSINLNLEKDYAVTLEEINRICPETVNKLRKNLVNIQPKTLDDRDKILKILRDNKKEFVHFESFENRPLKVVIKGLAMDQDKEELKLLIEKENFKVINISQLRNFREKRFYDIFLIDIAKIGNYQNIYNLRKLKNLNINVQTYRKRTKAIICYRCNRFYHSARNCEFRPRCIKCNGEHETRICEIKRVEKPKCINCNEEGHLAGWRGCPKIPIIEKQITYAEKLKLNIPTKKPEIPEFAQQQKEENLEINDFGEIKNAMKIIKDALNEFPNLIEIANELRKAKNKIKRLEILLKLID